MKTTGKVSTKGQLIIPAKLRRKHGIASGTRVVFDEVEGGIIIRPITESSIRKLRGILRGKKWPLNIEKEPDREIG